MFEDRLAAIRARVDRLRSRRGRHWKEFRVASHSFAFAPPASPGEIRGFEALHGVTIPAELRMFHCLLGDGGAGPYYGISPVRQWCAVGGALALPCPLAPGVPLPRWIGHVPGVAQVHPYDGLLAICSIGCSYECTVVVTGPARGRVCYISEDLLCEAPYFVAEPGFLAWYERWLDEIEAGVDLSWFGFGPRRTDPMWESRIEPLAHDPDVSFADGFDDHVPVQALIDDCLGHPSSEARAAAARRLGSVRQADAIWALGRAVEDAEPAVRRSAVRSLLFHRRRGEPLMDEIFLRQLDCPDPNVVQVAILALVELRGRHAWRLLPLLGHPDEGVRAVAAFGLSRRGGFWAVSALLGSLSDRGPEVRVSAIHALGCLRSREAVPMLESLAGGGADALLSAHVHSALSRIAGPSLRQRIGSRLRTLGRSILEASF